MFDKLDTEFRINLLKYRNLSECSTEEIIEEVYDYITIKRYSSNTADMFLYAWGLHFLKCHVKNKQQWGSLVYLIKKKKRKKEKRETYRKTISGIYTLEYLAVLGFIQNIELWSFGAKVPPEKVF